MKGVGCIQNPEEEFKKAIKLEKNNKFKEAREKYKNIIHMVQRMNLEREEKAHFLANCWLRIANTFSFENYLKKSKESLLKARNYAKQVKDKLLPLRINMLEAVLFEKSNNFKKAERILQSVFDSLKKLPRDYNTRITEGWCLLILGRVYMKEEKIIKAETCFNKALKILKKINNFVGIARVYEIKGEFAKKQNRFKRSRLNFEKAREYYKLAGLKNQVRLMENKIKDLHIN